jgi:hypothetical protein
MKCYYCQQELTIELISDEKIHLCKRHLNAIVQHNFFKPRDTELELRGVSIRKRIGEDWYRIYTAFPIAVDDSTWTIISKFVPGDSYRQAALINQVTSITPENFEDKVKLYILLS